MAQELTVFAAEPDDPSSMPSTQMVEGENAPLNIVL